MSRIELVELTLSLSARTGSKVARLPAIKAARAGRARSRPVRWIFHDTPGRALMDRGQVVCEERGLWRLMRIRPDPDEAWHPGLDHHVLAEASAPGDLTPEPVAAAAAFDGRETRFSLVFGTETVDVAILDGELRTIAAARPEARLMLSGPDGAVRTLARDLAAEMDLAVPRAALGAEAISLADGQPPRPRRAGAPAVAADSASTIGLFRQIIGHLADVLLSHAPAAAANDGDPEPVHQMRVAVRRARSAIALFTPVLEPDEIAPLVEGLRQLGRALGPARDWDVFMTETVPPVVTALSGRDGLAALERKGGRQRAAAHTALTAWLSGVEFRRLIVAMTCVAAEQDTPAADPPPGVFAARALAGRLKKLLRAGRSLADLDDAALHDVRLKAKRLRYAAEFFAPLFPDRQAARFIHRLADLQDRLGVFNDTTVAEDLLRHMGGAPGQASGLVLGFTAARGAAVRPKIEATWARFCKRTPFWE